MRSLTVLAALAALVALAKGYGDASVPKATPIPGGANQRTGTSGPITSELFNGKLRLRKMSLTHQSQDGDSYLVFSTLIANGTKEDRVTLLEAHLADADGVTIDQTPGDPVEGPCTLAPGAACRESFRFKLSPNDFKPVKILVEELGNGPQPVFRIILPAT